MLSANLKHKTAQMKNNSHNHNESFVAFARRLNNKRNEDKKKNCVAHIATFCTYVTCNAICIYFTHRDQAALFHCHQHHRKRAHTQVLLLQRSASTTHSLNGTQKQNDATEECARPVAIYDQMHIFVFHFFSFFLSDFIFQLYSFSLNRVDVCLCPSLFISPFVCVCVFVSLWCFLKSNGILHFSLDAVFSSAPRQQHWLQCAFKTVVYIGRMAVNGTCEHAIHPCETHLNNIILLKRRDQHFFIFAGCLF